MSREFLLDGVLHRHLDDLAFSGGLTLPQRGQYSDDRVHAGPGVANVDARPDRRTAWESGCAEGAARGLRHRVEALVSAVRAVGAKPLDGRAQG